MKFLKTTERTTAQRIMSFLFAVILFAAFSTTAILAQPSGFEAPVSLTDQGLINVFDIQMHDMDGDGDLDVIAFGSFSITWFANLGDGTFGESQTIAESEMTILDAEAGDLDGDDDTDVVWLTLTEQGVHYSLNDGEGQFSGITDVDVYGSSVTTLSLQDGTNDAPKILVKSLYMSETIREVTGFPNETSSETLELSGRGPVYLHDLNKDGKDDYLVVIGNTSSNRLELVNIALSTEGESFNTRELNAIENAEENYQEAASGLLIRDRGESDSTDIIVSTFYQINWKDIRRNGYLYRYRYTDGQFQTTIIDSLEVGFEDIQLIDIDSDGIEDLIASTYVNLDLFPRSEHPQKVFWYKGTEDGSFGERQVLKNNEYEFTRLLAEDVDSDEMDELVSLSMDGTRIEWLDKISGPTFNNSNIIADSPIANAHLVSVEDLTGDGNKGLVIGAPTKGKGLIWFKGEGEFNFSNQGVIDSSLSDVLQIELQDLNGDGMKDIVVLSSHIYQEYRGGDFYNRYQLSWYQNQGDGFSGEAKVITESDYHPEDKYFPQSFLVYDDGNGAKDIYLNLGYRTELFAADGVGNFVKTSTTEFEEIQYSQHLTDINSDGTLEVASVTSSKDSVDVGRPSVPIYAYSNNFRAAILDVELSDTVATLPLHSGSLGDFLESNIKPVSLHFAPFNNDERVDAAGATANPYLEYWRNDIHLKKVYWVKRGDSADDWKYINIDSSRVNYNDMNVADIDQDGDMDLAVNQDVFRVLLNNLEIGYQFGTLQWYENDGDGTFIKRAPIDSLRKSLQQMVAADLDGDGKPEIIAAAQGEQSVLIYKNNAMHSVANEYKNEDVNTYALHQNYPNPFNPTTSIQYRVPRAGPVKLQVYNILGQLVQTLVDQRQFSGLHMVRFDASKLSSGVYIYRLSAQGVTKTKKMMLIK